MSSQTDVTEVEQVIVFLVAAFPSANISADTIAVYVEMLSDLEPALLKLAAKKAITDGRFFPSVNELREAVAQLVTPPTASGSEAWGEVVRMAIEHGHNSAPGTTWDFSDPVTRRAVAALGWRDICLADEGTMMWPFIKAYDAMSKRQHDDARQLPEVRAQVARLGSGAPMRLSELIGRLPAPGQPKDDGVDHDQN